jgi:putative transposase
MAISLRMEFEGACYHIISRGSNRGIIFKTKDDYQDFLDLLEQLSDRFLITIYAYVLMGNHLLLLETLAAV